MKVIQKILVLMIFISSLILATTLKTWKEHYPAGNSVWIKVENKPNNPKDWVGIYSLGTNNDWDNVVQWKWAKDIAKGTEDPGEWYEFDKLTDGNYEARFFLNNTYVIESFITFSVGNVAQLSTSKNRYNVNEDITVKIVNQEKDNQNWIGVYSENASNDWGNVVVWDWTKGKKNVILDGLSIGHYEARLFYNNSFRDEAKVRFSVTDVDKKYPHTTTLTKRLTDNSVSRPSVGEPSIDNVFGTQIKMLNKGDYVHDSPYPKIQAWNSDMTLMRIGFRLYNAKTLEESTITSSVKEVGGKNGTYNKLCAPNSSDFRWSSKDPNKFYVVNSSIQLIEGEIVGNGINCHLLFDFKKNNFEQANIGPGEGNIDFNDKYIAFPVKKKGDDRIYILLYDLSDGKKGKQVWNQPKLYDAEGALWIKIIKDNGYVYWTPEVLDWVSVSPSGKYIVINDSETGMYRYDINFQNKRRLEYIDGHGDVSSQGGHGDIGFDTNKNEVFVQFISGTGIYSFNLDNPDEKGKELLDSPYGGGFISCRNILHRGWCYITTREKGFQEIFALQLDGTSNKTVQRFTQTHADWYGGSVSPDGTKVIFTNSWGNDKRDTFIAEAQ